MNRESKSGISRRAFVKSSAGALVAGTALGFPNIVRADDKAGDKPLILGKDDHQYELVAGWAKLPPNITFGNTHSVQETADGRMFVHHTGQHSMCVFDPDGKFIESWGEQFAGNAHGMDLRKEGNDEFLYLAPTGMHKVFKTTLKGEVVMTWEYPKDAKNKAGQPCYKDAGPYVPTFTAFAPNGDFYVTDGYGQGYIHRYSIKGDYISSWGGKGNADDETACPHGIYCDTRDADHPMIVVADREHHRLQYFTLDGKFDHLVKNEMPAQDGDGTGKFRRPCHFNQRGTEMVIPDLSGRVTVLDNKNNVIVQLGDNPNVSQRANNGVPQAALVPGVFCCPHGATFDKAGDIYVAEWLPYGRVTKLKKV